MHRWYKHYSNDIDWLNEYHDGITLTKDGKACSIVFLNHEDLGSGILSHECFHAVRNAMVYWGYKGNLLKNGQTEERFAIHLGDLVKTFWSVYYEDEMEREVPTSN